jgi:hypothetical protein
MTRKSQIYQNNLKTRMVETQLAFHKVSDTKILGQKQETGFRRHWKKGRKCPKRMEHEK